MAEMPAARRPPPMGRLVAMVATLGLLAGCGGQSGRGQAAAAAQAYNRAFVAANGRMVCALMSSSLRHEIGGSGLGKQTSCAEFMTFDAATRQHDFAPHLLITAVHISGSQATVTIRGQAGVGTLPLSREGGRWRVAGPVEYTIRNWLQADYRITNAGRLSARAVASIIDSRAKTIIGAPAHARDIGRDEVRLDVTEPTRLADLTPVTRRDNGRLAFYDWEANALTPAGRPVSQELRNRDPTAMLISQGSGTEPPGTPGGLSLRAAIKLAAAQHPIAGSRPSEPQVRGVPPGWIVVAGEGPGAQYFVLRDRAALSRSDVEFASMTFDALGRPAIAIQFTPHGARAFQKLSAEIARRGATLSTPGLALNQHLAEVLDGKLVSVVYIDYHVYPRGIPADEATDIAGGFSPLATYRLANEIAAEPLPADLHLIRATTISLRVPPGADLPAGGTTGPRQPAGPA